MGEASDSQPKNLKNPTTSGWNLASVSQLEISAIELVWTSTSFPIQSYTSVPLGSAACCFGDSTMGGLLAKAPLLQPLTAGIAPAPVLSIMHTWDYCNQPPIPPSRSTRFEIGGIGDHIPLIKVMTWWWMMVDRILCEPWGLCEAYPLWVWKPKYFYSSYK